MSPTATPSTVLSCGPTAAARLAPYEARISGNFEIPRHVGKLIACWDRPQCVPAAEATHMRDDDYVVGLVSRGHARAYPLWVTDNYHMINDRLAGDPLLFSTCERCQSGSAFLSRLGGRDVKFSALGMYNASLTMVNRKRSRGESHSLWLHYEGVALDGPDQGAFLDQIPTYHMTWADWVAAHPETDVMSAPNDPRHRDARHGHGREEYFGRPGMDPPLAKTITGHFDERYPENALVLGVNIDAGIRAWPLVEIQRSGGVVHDHLGDLGLVVWAGPRPDQATLAAFLPRVGDRDLHFRREPEGFRDAETGSLWSVEGRALDGPLRGAALQALRWQVVRWHAWVYPHPSTELYRCASPLPRWPEFPDSAAVTTLRPLLEALAGTVEDLRWSHVLTDLARPQGAEAGLVVRADGERLRLHAFPDVAAAADYRALEGAQFCWPFDAKHGRARLRRLGRFVLVSDPESRYAEPTQTVGYPDNQVPWSRLVQVPSAASDWGATLNADPGAVGPVSALLEGLRARRYDVVECAFLPASQQRPGTLTAVSATIEADRFALYRCASDADAVRVAAEVGHALVAGVWVLRSIPVLMYQDPHYEMGQLPDERIPWSKLLQSERFAADLSVLTAAAASGPR